MSIATYLTALDRDRDALAANLTTKGVPASSSETFTTLVPKVLDIPSGGGGGGIEWNTNVEIMPTNTVGATDSNFKNLGYGVKKITIENVTFFAGSNGTNWCLGFPNLEEVTFKNCTFGKAGNAASGVSIVGTTSALLNKVTIKNCIMAKGTAVTPSLGFTIRGGQPTDLIMDGVTFETGITSLSGFFSGCGGMRSITFNNIVFNDSIVNLYRTFYTDSTLTSVDFSILTATPTNVKEMFSGCTSLATIDISGLDCTGITSSSNYTNMFNNVPTTCTIYVKDAANQAWFSSKFSSYTFTIKT